MIVCDTGPLVAALNANDRRHDECVDLLESHPGPLLVPAPVLTEVAYFLESRVGPDAEAGFLRSLAEGELELASLTGSDLSRMVDLVVRYADFPLGAVDASVPGPDAGMAAWGSAPPAGRRAPPAASTSPSASPHPIHRRPRSLTAGRRQRHSAPHRTPATPAPQQVRPCLHYLVLTQRGPWGSGTRRTGGAGAGVGGAG